MWIAKVGCSFLHQTKQVGCQPDKQLKINIGWGFNPTDRLKYKRSMTNEQRKGLKL